MNLRFIASLFIVLTSTACSDYWWQRGQAPGVEQLVDRAQARLQENIDTNTYSRSEFVPLAVDLEQSLISSYSAAQKSLPKDQVAKHLDDTVSRFNKLEGKISVTSRAAYAELHGQARAFRNAASSGENVSAEAYGMFAARSLFFLANEMEVPAPTFGA